MELKAAIFEAEVMHKRTLPRENSFRYQLFYLALPLNALADDALHREIAINRSGWLSFHSADHGARDDSALEDWFNHALEGSAAKPHIEQVQLIALPRVFGYVFNPVSFWMGYDADGALRAVLCEVNNTFGETHSYLCAHEHGQPLTQDDWLEAEKLFHVSPFLERSGNYRFRFAPKREKLGIWIDYINADGEAQLLTSLVGRMQPLTRAALRQAAWRVPWVTAKTILLIHLQAIKLWAKKIQYIPKPEQLVTRLSYAKEQANNKATSYQLNKK